MKMKHLFLTIGLLMCGSTALVARKAPAKPTPVAPKPTPATQQMIRAFEEKVEQAIKQRMAKDPKVKALVKKSQLRAGKRVPLLKALQQDTSPAVQNLVKQANEEVFLKGMRLAPPAAKSRPAAPKALPAAAVKPATKPVPKIDDAFLKRLQKKKLFSK